MLRNLINKSPLVIVKQSLPEIMTVLALVNNNDKLNDGYMLDITKERIFEIIDGIQLTSLIMVTYLFDPDPNPEVSLVAKLNSKMVETEGLNIELNHLKREYHDSIKSYQLTDQQQKEEIYNATALTERQNALVITLDGKVESIKREYSNLAENESIIRNILLSVCKKDGLFHSQFSENDIIGLLKFTIDKYLFHREVKDSEIPFSLPTSFLSSNKPIQHQNIKSTIGDDLNYSIKNAIKTSSSASNFNFNIPSPEIIKEPISSNITPPNYRNPRTRNRNRN
jgi:hypothetical protein